MIISLEQECKQQLDTWNILQASYLIKRESNWTIAVLSFFSRIFSPNSIQKCEKAEEWKTLDLNCSRLDWESGISLFFSRILWSLEALLRTQYTHKKESVRIFTQDGYRLNAKSGNFKILSFFATLLFAPMVYVW